MDHSEDDQIEIVVRIRTLQLFEHLYLRFGWVELFTFPGGIKSLRLLKMLMGAQERKKSKLTKINILFILFLLLIRREFLWLDIAELSWVEMH